MVGHLHIAGQYDLFAKEEMVAGVDGAVVNAHTDRLPLLDLSATCRADLCLSCNRKQEDVDEQKSKID